jgi:hypothetical protein
MYSKQEASRIRSKFWTAFGQYMRPVQGADGDDVNWLNYKTGVKDLFFRMDANQKQASIAVEFRQQFPEERYRIYDSWLSLKGIFEQQLPGDWKWERDVADDDGRIIARISTASGHASLFREEDWPVIISFLKTRIVALDAFWMLVRDQFT